MMTTQPSAKKRLSFLMVLGIIIGICIFCIIASFAMDALGLLPETTPIPTSTFAPTQTPLPSATATQPITPEQAFEQTLIDVLGTSNRDVPRLTGILWSPTDGDLMLQWTINDNFGENLILRGAMLDVVNMLKQISQNPSPYPYQTITFDGSFLLVDQFGNSTEERVILASYTAETIQKINWEGFLTDNIFIVADSSFIHPALNP